MKLCAPLLLLPLGLTWARAEVPSPPAPLDSYALLWTQSHLTRAAGVAQAKDEPVAAEEGPGPISDWSLLGLARFDNGPRITLGSKKMAGKTLTLQPGAKGPYSVVGIDWGNGSLDRVAVTLSDGKDTQALHFDESVLKPKPKPKPAAEEKPPRAVLIPEP